MITVRDIREAKDRLEGLVIRTPLVYSPTFSAMTGAKVFLKLESLQLAGSFKVRGAANRILKDRSQIGPGGVIAASAGNHAQGVAVAAHLAGVHATVVMPVNSSITKQEAARGYGADVILHGRNLMESLEKAKELAAGGMVFIHPYDDPGVIAGQGTIGLEILEDLPEPDLIIVPVGGGGLISGISIAIKELHPSCRVVGVQSELCPSAIEALCPSVFGAYPAARVRPPGECRSLADGIMVKGIGEITLPIIREYVDDIVLATENGIADAMVMLMERKRVIAEGAGAAPLAALLGGHVPVAKGSSVVLLISGGNVDSSILERVVRRGLMESHRIMRIYVVLEDVPGALSSLLAAIDRLQGNVIYIHHMRGERDLPVTSVRVEMEVETRGERHRREMLDGLIAAGFSVKEGM